jgi:type I restriction enzyme M protein
MPRGTLTSTQGGDDALRGAFLDDDIVECIVDLPGQLFHNTQIPAVLWFFNKDKSRWKNNRKGQVLFIDARKMGTPVSRKQIEFAENEVNRIAEAFYLWSQGEYRDIDGFCRSVSREEVSAAGDNLSPGRFIGSELGEAVSDGNFQEDMLERAQDLQESFNRSRGLELEIVRKLRQLGLWAND